MKLSINKLVEGCRHKISVFWAIMGTIAMLACLFCWFLINGLVEEERDRMLNAMHGRAQSLIWSLESGARFCRGRADALSGLFVEMAKQPGIAWIALVARDGHILLDSNPELTGQSLYTPGEMEALVSRPEAQGRFSPDDPDIFETWTLFNPWRLRGSKHRPPDFARERPYIFVAMNAMDFRQSLTNYVNHMRLISGLIILAAMGAIMIAFYAYNLSLSRRQLADERAFSTLVIKSYPSPMFATDSSLNINLANDTAREIFGITKNDSQANLRQLKNFDWQSLIMELTKNKAILDRQTEITDAAGHCIPVSLTAAAIGAGRGEPAGYLFVFRNLAEINLLKNKLRQSERLSSLGKLASGLAHEIRNPLSSICGYANYLGKKLQDDPMGAGAARLLVDEAQRVNGVLTELLTLAKPPALDLQKHSLADILQKTKLLVAPDAGAKQIDVDFEDTSGPAGGSHPIVDRDRLTQAFLNLLLNAVQAVPEGGKVLIGLEYSDKPRDSREKAYFAASGPFWRIKIKDTGPGMGEEIKKQIFTPYFTTKASGSGLGLPITREIVESHDGIIYVSSKPGIGTEFTILLPAGADK